MRSCRPRYALCGGGTAVSDVQLSRPRVIGLMVAAWYASQASKAEKQPQPTPGHEPHARRAHASHIWEAVEIHCECWG